MFLKHIQKKSDLLRKEFDKTVELMNKFKLLLLSLKCKAQKSTCQTRGLEGLPKSNKQTVSVRAGKNKKELQHACISNVNICFIVRRYALKVLVSYCIVFIIEETALFSAETTVICCNLVCKFFVESDYIERCTSMHRPKPQCD